MTIRVAIAEDHRLVADAVATMIGFEESIVVVGIASSGAEVIDLVAATEPDVVLMDISLEGLNGIEATRAIVARDPGARVLVLSMHDDDESVTSAMAAGARGFLPKNVHSSTLLEAIHAIARGDAWLDPTVAGAFLDRVRPLAAQTLQQELLTEREQRVLELLADGLSTKAIAEALHVSEETVKTHLGHIYRKLGVADRVQAVVRALRDGLVR